MYNNSGGGGIPSKFTFPPLLSPPPPSYFIKFIKRRMLVCWEERGGGRGQTLGWEWFGWRCLPPTYSYSSFECPSHTACGPDLRKMCAFAQLFCACLRKILACRLSNGAKSVWPEIEQNKCSKKANPRKNKSLVRNFLWLGPLTMFSRPSKAQILMKKEKDLCCCCFSSSWRFFLLPWKDAPEIPRANPKDRFFYKKKFRRRHFSGESAGCWPRIFFSWLVTGVSPTHCVFFRKRGGRKGKGETTVRPYFFSKKRDHAFLFFPGKFAWGRTVRKEGGKSGINFVERGPKWPFLFKK